MGHLLFLFFVSLTCTGLVSSRQIIKSSTCGRVGKDQLKNNIPVMLPWAVTIIDGEGNFVASGSLIREDVVLTSDDVDRENNLDFTVQLASGELSGIRKIVLQEDVFNTTHLNKNLALVFLNKWVRLGPSVSTVCLFGKTSLENCFGYQRKSVLYDAEDKIEVFNLPVLANDKCQDLMQKENVSLKSIDGSYICTDGENSEHCRGFVNDWGTGIFCPHHNDAGDIHYVQVGVSAWGMRCNGSPGGYTRVDYFAKWIEEKINNQFISLDEVLQTLDMLSLIR